MQYLYTIILKNTGNGETVYKENMPFSKEPTVEEIQDLIKFLRPFLRYDWVDWEYYGTVDYNTGKIVADKEVY